MHDCPDITHAIIAASGNAELQEQIDVLDLALVEELRRIPALHLAAELGVEIPRDRGYGHGKLVEELWEHSVGNTLTAPTFV